MTEDLLLRTATDDRSGGRLDPQVLASGTRRKSSRTHNSHHREGSSPSPWERRKPGLAYGDSCQREQCFVDHVITLYNLAVPFRWLGRGDLGDNTAQSSWWERKNEIGLGEVNKTGGLSEREFAVFLKERLMLCGFRLRAYLCFVPACMCVVSAYNCVSVCAFCEQGVCQGCEGGHGFYQCGCIVEHKFCYVT